MSTISKPFFSLGNPNGAPYSRVKNSPRNYEGYFFYNCKWKHFILYKDSNQAKNLKGIVSRTVATLGALEGGARYEVVGGIGPKGRSSGDYTLQVFP